MRIRDRALARGSALGRGHVQGRGHGLISSVRSAMSSAAARLRVMDSVPPEVRPSPDRLSRHLRRTRPAGSRCESSACVVATFSESSMRVRFALRGTQLTQDRRVSARLLVGSATALS